MTLAKGTPTIIRGSDHFFNNTYEGNGQGQRVGNFVPYTDNGTISNSCIFNRPDDPMLAYTPSGTGTNRRKYTVSFWFKPSFDGSDSNERAFFFAGPYGNDDGITFKNTRKLHFWINGTVNASLLTTRTFEDSSKFYHILVAVDTTQSSASDRVKLYVDGDQITNFDTENYPSQNYDGYVSTAVQHNVGAQTGNNRQCDGYLAEVNYVDGTALTPSTFGLTDTSTGRWIPKTLTGITYGTNGFRLTFANSAGQTIGDDTSGNGNDLTVTNLATTDIVTDTPTDLYPVLNDFQSSYSSNFSEGNLKIDGSTNGQTSTGRSTLSFDVEDSTGYYFEFRNMGTSSFGSNFNGYGIVGVNADNIAPSSGNLFPNGGHHVTLQEDGNVRINNTGTNLNLGGSTLPKTGNTSTRDTIGCAVKSGKVWFSKNGIWGNANQGNPNSDGTPIASGLTGRFRACALCYDNDNSLQEVNFGQRLALGGSATSDYSANNGGYFLYPPPTGFRALKQDNLPETTLSIPDFVWAKSRDNTESHVIYDTTRGVQKMISPNNTTAEGTQTDGLQKFLVGGFQTEDHERTNQSGISYANWNWIANGGTTATNEVGAINSTVQVNTTAGFSIVKYSGSGGAASVGHGLSSAPEWMIFKDLGNSTAWRVYHTSIGGITKYLVLNTTAAVATASMWGTPTNSAFIIGGTGYEVNESGNNYVAYCWHSVPGFSKFGSYIGNGSSNGPFINLGFKPAVVITKNISSSYRWNIIDSKRDPFNPAGRWLAPNDNSDEDAYSGSYPHDFLSNGYKLRANTTVLNRSGDTYAYAAFAEHPFLGDGTNPATAR